MTKQEKILQKIKDDYVKDNFLASHELDTWFDFQNYFQSRHPEWFEQHWDEICKRYASEVIKEASEVVSLKDNWEEYTASDYIDKQSILKLIEEL